MTIERPMQTPVYIVTDIEADGPAPGRHSMLSFASVAVTADGEERGVFEAVLAPLPGAVRDPQVYDWFQSQPGAWEAATLDPKPPEQVMADYVAWLQGFAEGRVFCAFPLAFDGSWIDYYLRRFTRFQLVEGAYAKNRLFDGTGLCLNSFAAALVGKQPWEVKPKTLPPEWLGNFEHTHKAIDDTRGYAHLLGVLMKLSRERVGVGA
jgi:hypothetical protein